MKIKLTTLAVSAAAALAGATASQAATVNIATEAGTTYNTEFGIRDDTTTRGADLIGMEVGVSYADGTSENLIWSAIGNTFGVIGAHMQVTFRSSGWDLSATESLASMTMNALSVNSMFDILAMRDGDTPTTGRGFGFNIRDANVHQGEITATYSNQITYQGADPEGDTFTEMSVDFTGLWGGGLTGDLEFSTDFDTLRVAGDLTAVPAGLTPVPVPGGLPLLASGALLLGFMRRKTR
jgi:hypothetical protein